MVESTDPKFELDFWFECYLILTREITPKPIAFRMQIRSYMQVWFQLRSRQSLADCSLQHSNTRTLKTLKRVGAPSKLDIRQVTTDVKLASKCSFKFGSLGIKFHPKSHPVSIQKLYRIHDQICLRCQIDSRIIVGSWGELKISQIALRSLGDLVFGYKTRSLFLT